MKVVLRDLTKTFPSVGHGTAEVTAVNNFNIEFPDGTLVGLLGPSGCGKSTALNLISGLLTSTSGRIFFGDKDVTELPPEKRGVGLVFQSYALYPHLTARQNIAFPLENLRGKDRLSRNETAKRVTEAAKLVQIENILDRKPKEMSGGQQQRVAIARALVKLPKVLLLDEPLSNLDARLRLQTREELRRIQQETGITTVFVTHDQEEAMSISDSIVVMNAGVIQQHGKPQSVYDDPCNLFVAKFLGNPAINLFDGEVKDGRLFIAGENVLNAAGAPDGHVTVGIRPEGFIVSKYGAMSADFRQLEVMGRDVSIVFESKAAQGRSRAIVDASSAQISGTTVRFELKREKVHLFSAESGERIRFNG